MSPTPEHHEPGTLDAHDPRLLVPVAALTPFHRNARRGDVDAIARSLQANAQYRPITVNRGTSTGRPDEVLVGNHTLAAARQLGWSTIAAVFVDVDDRAAAKIVLGDNRLSDIADYEPRELGVLLAEVHGDYEGTGFVPQDVDDIADLIAKADRPLPTGPTAPLRSDRTRMIRCPSCHHEFDSTDAVETRVPVGGRA